MPDTTRIKLEIINKNITQKDIANKWGLSPSTLNLAINGRIEDDKCAEAIAQELGLPLGELGWEPTISKIK